MNAVHEFLKSQIFLLYFHFEKTLVQPKRIIVEPFSALFQAMSEEALTKVEKELKDLKDDLKVHEEAKTKGEACAEIIDYCEKNTEPFVSAEPGSEPNKWHKNPKSGGGCAIL